MDYIFLKKEFSHLILREISTLLMEGLKNENLLAFPIKKAEETLFSTFHLENQILPHQIVPEMKLGGILYGFNKNIDQHLSYFISWRRQYPHKILLLHLPEEELSLKSIQIAFDLGFDGIFINPETKKIKEIAKLFSYINTRNMQHISSKHEEAFELLRDSIDALDKEIFHLISLRLQKAENIAALKFESNMPIYQVMRWEHMLNKSKSWALEFNLKEETVINILNSLHLEGIKAHQKAYEE